MPKKHCRKCLKMLPSQEEISQVPHESEDIFKRNIMDRYMERQDGLFCNFIMVCWKIYGMLNFLDIII